MNTEYAIIGLYVGLVFVTFLLVLVTYYYARITKKILKEQRKAAELTVIPYIEYTFQKNGENYDFYVGASMNSLFNATARVFVNGTLKGKQRIGNAIYRPSRKDIHAQNTHAFHLTPCLEGIDKDKDFVLSIEISYETRTGSNLVERYTWKAVRISEKKELKIKGYYPDKREIVSAPWL